MPAGTPWMENPHIPAAIVEPLAGAVESDRAGSVARVLAHLGREGAFEDGRWFAPPNASHYSRYPLWRDARGRFSIISMTWLPGQGTPVHDHAGRWGAELVVRGAMRETQYNVVARGGGGRMRLDATAPETMRASDVGVIVPTVDVHAFHNVGSGVAHTIHVYSTLRDACTAFTRDDDGWWNAQRVEFTLDG